MIGGLSGLAAVVAGIACLVLVPLPLLVIVGVVMQASGTTLLILALFYGWLMRAAWRWFTKPCVEPNEGVVQTARGTRPESEGGTVSAGVQPQHKDGVTAGARSSLDDPEQPHKGPGVA